MPTEYGDIGNRTGAYAEAKMLSHAEPVLVLQKFALTKPMPKNKTETIKWRRPIPFSPLTAPAVEGVTPQAQAFNYEDVVVNLLQWIVINEITDKVDDLSEDPVLNDIVMLQGEQMGATVEQVLWGIVRGGTNVFYANGTARTDVNTVVTLSKQQAVVRFLKAQKGKMITSILAPSVNYGTRAVEGSYVAFAHTDVESDIRKLPDFVPTAKYGQRSVLCPEELGSVENVRYITSPDLNPFLNAGGAPGSTVVSTGGSAADVYPIIYIAKEAFGAISLKGQGSIKPMILNPNTPRGGDPAGQRGTIATKTWFNGVILNQAWIARLEVAATKL